jgi:6-bladed beta-propeller protein
MICVFSFFCSPGKDGQSINIINFDSFKVTEKNFSNLMEIGTITRTVKLETMEKSIIGSIDSLIVDPKNGDLIIGDFRSSKKVIRFNKEGKFICSYGKKGQGPGEYLYLRAYTETSNGDVIILTSYKLIKYSKDGAFLKEVRIDFSSKHLTVIDDLIYISVLKYRKKPGVKNAVIVLNPHFVKIGGIGNYDSRLEKTRYLFHNVFAKKGKQLYYLDYYDPNLNIYNSESKRLQQLQIPNENSKLDKTWGKKKITQDDDMVIHKTIHRFVDIFSISDRILLSEFCIEKNIFNLWLLNLEKKEILIFPKKNLLGENAVKLQKDLFFNRIPGSFENGIVGAFDDVEEFNLYKYKYPTLKDIEFKADDNPILVFFEFNQ